MFSRSKFSWEGGVPSIKIVMNLPRALIKKKNNIGSAVCASFGTDTENLKLLYKDRKIIYTRTTLYIRKSTNTISIWG